MFKLSAVALVALVASMVSAQQINTPTTGLFTCDPYLITFSGGQAPYTIRANQGGSTSQVLETIVSGLETTSYTWNVNLAAGTSVTLALTDASGQTNYADAVTVQAGSSTSCVGLAASGSSASSGAASASSTVSSTSAASSARSEASSSATGAASSARSAASSAVSGASSIASKVSSGAAAATSAAGGTSGASTLVVSGGLAAVAGLAAIMA